MKTHLMPAFRLEEERRSVLRLSEAARHLGVQPQALRKRITRGNDDLEIVVIGRLHFVRTDSLRRMLGVGVEVKTGGAA